MATDGMDEPGPTEVELETHSLVVESKRVYLNLRQNRRGRFLKIAEVTPPRRSTVIIPESGLRELRNLLDRVIERCDTEGEVDPSAFPAPIGGGGAAGESRHSFARGPREESSSGLSLWVENLSWDTTDDQFRALFEPFGAIEACAVQRRPSGRSRGSGTVRFATADQAAAAMAAVNGQEVDGRELRVRLDRFD